MFIEKLYKLIVYLSGKNQTGYHSPDDIMGLLHMVQTELFNKYTDTFPSDKQSVHLLKPFMKVETLQQNPVEKVFPFNKGIVESVVTPDGSPIIWKPGFAFNQAIKSKIAPPTSEYPIYTIRRDYGIEVAPTSIATIKVFYLVQPTEPVFKYTQNGRRYEFNPTGSVDVLWPEPAHPSLIMRVLEKLGIKVREEELIQYSKIQEQHEIKA